MKKIFLISMILVLFNSCSDGGVETISKPLGPEVSALHADINQLEVGLSDSLFMRNSTKDEILLMKTYLTQARVLTTRLNSIPSDTMAAKELFLVLKKIEGFPFSARDEGLFENMLFRLRVTLSKFADIQNLDLAGIEWSLLKFQFQGKLSPFKTIKMFSESPIWQYGTFKADTYAKADSRGVKADTWLFSPVYDLSGSKKHQLLVKHIVRNPEWENFKLKISTDYDGANPQAATWKELKIKPNRGVSPNQWTTLESSPIDISDYTGKKVVFAFQFLATEKSNSVWEILKLEIKGTGNSVSSEELEVTYEPTPTDPPVSEDENN